MLKVIFACVHNAGRSQMAAAFFNQLADRTKAEAVSAGTEPGLRVHPEVLAVMQEIGIDLSAATPQKLTQELANDAALLITMGCGDKCPYVPGLRRDDWPLPDPKGRPMDEVRAVRDDIKARVAELIQAEGLEEGGSVTVRPILHFLRHHQVAAPGLQQLLAGLPKMPQPKRLSRRDRRSYVASPALLGRVEHLDLRRMQTVAHTSQETSFKRTDYQVRCAFRNLA